MNDLAFTYYGSGLDPRGVNAMPYRKKYSHRGYTDNLQKIIMYFLVGFFIGAVFYYLFQNSFLQLKNQLENNVRQWDNDESFLTVFLHTIWSHGKYYVLFWIMAMGRWKKGYQTAFILYTGLRNGFFMMFLFFSYGAKGLFIALLSNFPQCLLFVPLYLYSIFYVNEKRQSKHRIGMGFAILFVFTAACLLEVKCNLPLMNIVL